MIRDRMPDLLKLAETDPTIYNEPEAHKAMPLDPKLAIMFKRVEKVVKFQSLMKEVMKELTRLHDKLLLSASSEQEQNYRNLIEKLGNRFSSLARKSKSVLKRFEMDEDIMRNYAATPSQNRESSDGIEMQQIRPHVTWHRLPSGVLIPLSSERYIPAEIRMRFHLHNIFAYELSCLVREYYIIQKIYGDRCREKIKRQMEIIGREIEETELEEAVHRREQLPLLHQEITDDAAVSEEMRLKLKEVESFHQDILKLEQNIEELHKSFVTISSLVYEHGDIINHIEQHIISSADYAEEGAQLLKKASGFQSKYRKKKCMLAICIAVIIAIIVIIIVVSVKKSHKESKTIVLVPSKKMRRMDYAKSEDIYDIVSSDFGTGY